MLRNETVDLNVTMGDWIDAWGATCQVQLTNKAGHKFHQAIRHAVLGSK